MITVIGCGTGSPPARIEDAALVVGAARHLAEAELPRDAERVTLGPLGPALDRIAAYVGRDAWTPANEPAAAKPEPRGASGGNSQAKAAEARARLGTVAEPREGRGAQHEDRSGAEPRAESAAETSARPGTEPPVGPVAEPHWGQEVRPQAGSGAQPRAGLGAQPQAGSGAQPQAGLGALPQAGSGAQPQAGLGALPQAGSEDSAPGGGLGGGAPGVRGGAGAGRSPHPPARVVVLASGDPGFFGIVRVLAERFGPRLLDIRPAVPSLAVAFARAGLPWDDAAVVSAHGRDLRTAVNVCRAHPKTAVLTGPGAGPAELGAALAGSGVPRTLVVGTGLGSAGEDIAYLDPADAAARTWPPQAVNVVLCLDPRPGRTLAPAQRVLAGPGRYPLARRPGDGWALPEGDFAHRAGMVTKYEVRALALARLAPRLGDLMWDVGAGSGSVAVECARFGAAVVAVERDAGGVVRIRANAAAHGVDVRAVHGTAPAALAGLPDPDAVFVGGGGDDVAEVVAACARRARRTVVVTLAAVDRVPGVRAALAAAGYAVDGVLLQSSRLAPLPGEVTRLAATNPVFVLWGRRDVPTEARPVAASGRPPDGPSPAHDTPPPATPLENP